MVNWLHAGLRWRRRRAVTGTEFVQPAAILIQLSRDTYSRFWTTERTDVVEAGRLACESYRLGRVLLDEEPEGGWADEHLFAAGAYLVAVGDLHAIRSVEWPDGLPEDARDTPEGLDRSLDEQGLVTWLSRASDGVLGVLDAATWTSKYGGLAVRNAPTPETTFSDDESLLELRQRENRAWEHYEKTRQDAASAIRWARQMHAQWYLHLDGAGDADWSFLDLATPRAQAARELAVCHQTSGWLHNNGGEAEACFAIWYASDLVREIYLMLSTRSLTEFRDLAIMPPEAAAQDAFDRFLEEWVERVLAEAPEQAA